MMSAATGNVSESDLIACVPNLHRFATSLTGSRERADDVVQDTIVRALTNAHRFEAGTNLKAWMLTILRNVYYSQLRKSRGDVWSSRDLGTLEPAVPPAQEARVEFGEFQRAFGQLGDDQRTALILVGAHGLSYDESARICNCAAGTMKSRVSRARRELRRIVEDGLPADRLPDMLAPTGGTSDPPTSGRPSSPAASPKGNAFRHRSLPIGAGEQITEDHMRPNQVDHARERRLRFVFNCAVVSCDLAADVTYGDIARRLGALSSRRYGHPVAIDVKLASREVGLVNHP